MLQGDNKLVVQGKLPSMVSELDMTAGGYTKTCSRYYMMTPNGEMLCKDEAGNIVATTMEEELPTGDDVSSRLNVPTQLDCLSKLLRPAAVRTKHFLTIGCTNINLTATVE